MVCGFYDLLYELASSLCYHVYVARALYCYGFSQATV